jgi:hypothetical protein
MDGIDFYGLAITGADMPVTVMVPSSPGISGFTNTYIGPGTTGAAALPANNPPRTYENGNNTYSSSNGVISGTTNSPTSNPTNSPTSNPTNGPPFKLHCY